MVSAAVSALHRQLSRRGRQPHCHLIHHSRVRPHNAAHSRNGAYGDLAASFRKPARKAKLFFLFCVLLPYSLASLSGSHGILPPPVPIFFSASGIRSVGEWSCLCLPPSSRPSSCSASRYSHFVGEADSRVIALANWNGWLLGGFVLVFAVWGLYRHIFPWRCNWEVDNGGIITTLHKYPTRCRAVLSRHVLIVPRLFFGRWMHEPAGQVIPAGGMSAGAPLPPVRPEPAKDTLIFPPKKSPVIGMSSTPSPSGRKFGTIPETEFPYWGPALSRAVCRQRPKLMSRPRRQKPRVMSPCRRIKLRCR